MIPSGVGVQAGVKGGPVASGWHSQCLASS